MHAALGPMAEGTRVKRLRESRTGAKEAIHRATPAAGAIRSAASRDWALRIGENASGRLGAGEKRTTRKRPGLTVHGIRKRLHGQWLQ
ncbi:hypothetical protein CBM2634_U70013 [Cupriavidus taiwanensis]|uniref:Uncharacterized protein n=1 Tax=Cupriavidus taiwanensis TaxID=164546 RepID=A0A375JEQ8_9BURK|nr:hypothetical protein CBM2634_U70013 [Cupriavidus taiwanensis]